MNQVKYGRLTPYLPLYWWVSGCKPYVPVMTLTTAQAYFLCDKNHFF